jgi:hypothetical protein
MFQTVLFDTGTAKNVPRAEAGERRKAQRFHLALPIQIVSLAQRRVDVAGKTRDLSANGAYFVVNSDLETGAPIEFFVTLQDLRPAFRRVKLRCRGHIIRLDKLGPADRWGVAATIDRYQFVRDTVN